MVGRAEKKLQGCAIAMLIQNPTFFRLGFASMIGFNRMQVLMCWMVVCVASMVWEQPELVCENVNAENVYICFCKSEQTRCVLCTSWH